MNFREYQARAKKAYYTNYMAMIFSKLSIRLSYAMAHTPVTPNQLTTLSTLVALTGAAMILGFNQDLRILGIAIWFIAYVLDFCDGEIARYKNMQTEFGHWFDEVTDRIKDVALFSAVTLLAVRQSSSVLAILCGLLALGGTIVYAYATACRSRNLSGETTRLSPGKFGHVNYVVMAILVGLDFPQLFLAFAATVAYCGLALDIYSARRASQRLRVLESA